MTDTSAESIWTRWTHHLVEVATVLGWILVAYLIAASYLGHSFSPYGTCYAKSGRSVQCLAGRR